MALALERDRSSAHRIVHLVRATRLHQRIPRGMQKTVPRMNPGTMLSAANTGPGTGLVTDLVDSSIASSPFGRMPAPQVPSAPSEANKTPRARYNYYPAKA